MSRSFKQQQKIHRETKRPESVSYKQLTPTQNLRVDTKVGVQTGTNTKRLNLHYVKEKKRMRNQYTYEALPFGWIEEEC